MSRSSDTGFAHGALGALLTVCGLASLASAARADQFVMTDASWTHSALTTSDSHYRVKPSAQTPKSLKSPVDYSLGSVRVQLDVKTKPAGDTPTRFQVCFEGSPHYACTDQSPSYTKAGQYVWITRVASFYQGVSDTDALKGIDYAKPISQVALILKDTANNKPQGDPKYVPTDLHIEVAWLSQGGIYAAPVGGKPDAGIADAGVTDAAKADPRDAASPSGDGSVVVPDPGYEDASTAPPDTFRDASLTSSRADAAATRNDAATRPSSRGDSGSDANEQTNASKSDSGCSAGRGSAPGGILGSLAALALAWSNRRRARTVRTFLT